MNSHTTTTRPILAAASTRAARMVWIMRDREGHIRLRWAAVRGWSVLALVCGQDTVVF